MAQRSHENTRSDARGSPVAKKTGEQVARVQSGMEIAREQTQLLKARGELAEVREQKNALAKYAVQLEKQIRVAEAVKSQALKPIKVPVRRGSRDTPAVPVVLVSDVHAAEIVRPGQLQNGSEHNPEISAARCEKLWQHTVKLVKFEQRRHEIHDVLLWLGGDFLTGEIHQDNIRSTDCTPTQETRQNLRMLLGGIRYLLRELDVDRILIETSYGNHGRTTMRPMVANGAVYSYEQLMYWLLADELAGESRIRMHVAEGQPSVADVGGYRIRFLHGDAVRYLGGIGGIQIPLWRKVAEWDRDTPCDLTCMGHYHRFQDLGFAIVNGSVIGQTPFGQRIGAASEAPTQAFFVVDLERRRKSVVCPIFLD